MEKASGQVGKRIALGTVARTPVVDVVAEYLTEQEWDVVHLETPDRDISWPEVGRDVGRLIGSGEVECGIALCWTGNGVAISGSTVPGVRAAYCPSADDARNAREWHDVNMLAGSLESSPAEMREIVGAWLRTDRFQVDQHAQAQDRMSAISGSS